MHQRALAIVVCTILLSAASSFPQQAANTFAQKSRTFHSSAEFAEKTHGAVKLQKGVKPADELRVRRVPVHLPVNDFTVIATENPTITWIGSAQGAVRLNTATRSVEYFAGERWLPDDRVTGIGFENGVTWIETGKGLSRIEYKSMTLDEKSRAFVERIQSRHNRWGLTATSELRVPGDVSSSRTISTDNDGLWTAMYVAADSFRYKVTGERDARDNARRGMEALLRLETITGIPGFPARSFIKVGEDVQPKDGEWHDTPDGQWRWKGDTSSDEIVGHYFVFPIYPADAEQRMDVAALRGAIDRITNHILDHNYQLVDVDGQKTRWGWWGPDVIWNDADETGLRALHLLSHLRVALHMTANDRFREKYQRAYDDLIERHRYHLLLRNQKMMVPGHINHSDDELAFLSYYPLLAYERDPARLEVYRESLERSWQIERPERNPLWNVIYAAGSGAAEYDRDAALRTLREIPMDMIQWSVRNSHRRDVPVDPLADRFKRRQALIVLPYDELPMSKWNGNPYTLDGGDGGRHEDDGAYFLLPYWMAVYHRLFIS